MIDMRILDYPDAPNLRELKIYVNGKLELSVLVDYMQIQMMKMRLNDASREWVKNE